jgi:hypothetical protein
MAVRSRWARRTACNTRHASEVCGHAWPTSSSESVELLTELFPRRIARICTRFHVFVPKKIQSKYRARERECRPESSWEATHSQTRSACPQVRMSNARRGLRKTSSARNERQSVRESVTGGQHGSRAELFPSPDNTSERCACHDSRWGRAVDAVGQECPPPNHTAASAGTRAALMASHCSRS